VWASPAQDISAIGHQASFRVGLGGVAERHQPDSSYSHTHRQSLCSCPSQRNTRALHGATPSHLGGGECCKKPHCHRQNLKAGSTQEQAWRHGRLRPSHVHSVSLRTYCTTLAKDQWACYPFTKKSQSQEIKRTLFYNICSIWCQLFIFAHTQRPINNNIMYTTHIYEMNTIFALK